MEVPATTPTVSSKSSTGTKIALFLIGGVLGFVFCKVKGSKAVAKIKDDTAKELNTIFIDMMDKAEKGGETLSGFNATWKESMKTVAGK